MRAAVVCPSLLLAVLLIGCGGPAPAPASAADTATIALGALEVYRREACACHDAPCADDVKARFAADFVPRYRDLTGTEAQAERAGAISHAMISCLIEAERASIAAGDRAVPDVADRADAEAR